MSDFMSKLKKREREEDEKYRNEAITWLLSMHREELEFIERQLRERDGRQK